MGWTIMPGASRTDIIHDRTRHWTNNQGTSGQCLRKCLRGNVLWTVWELTYQGGRTERYIGCDLLGTDGEGNWGYKDIEESMGPCETSCPIEYFDLVPPANPEWRARVRAARFHGSLRIGDRVRLTDGYRPNELVIISVRPLRGRDPDGGGSYRFSRRAIKQVLTTPSDTTPPSLFP